MKSADGTSILKGAVDLDGDGKADGTFVSATHTAGQSTITETRFSLIVDGHDVNYSVFKVATDVNGDGHADRVHEEGTGADGHKVFTDDTVYDGEGHMQSADHSTYDAAGHMIVKDHTIFDADGHEIGKDHSEYKYDAQGHVNAQDDIHYDSSGQVTDRDHTDYKYDGAGHLVENSHTDYNAAGAVEGSDRTTYSYDPDGHLIGQDTTYFDSHGQAVSKTHTSYDAAGHISSLDQTDVDDHGRVTSTDHKAYDTAGHLISGDHLTYNERGTLIGKSHTAYDSAGHAQFIDQTNYNARGSVVATTHTTYDSAGHAAASDITTFDVFGRVLDTRHIEHQGESGMDRTTMVAAAALGGVTLDASAGGPGQVPTSQKAPADAGNLKGPSKYKDKFDPLGRLVERISYNQYGDLVDKDTWSYIGKTRQVDVHSDFDLVNGKWTVHEVWDYNAKGLREDCFINDYDSQGKLVKWTDWNFQANGNESSKSIVNYASGSANDKTVAKWLGWRGETIPSGYANRTESWNFMSSDKADDHEIRQIYEGRWIVWNNQANGQHTCGMIACLNAIEGLTQKHADTGVFIDAETKAGIYHNGSTNRWDLPKVFKQYNINATTSEDNSLVDLEKKLHAGKEVILSFDAADVKMSTGGIGSGAGDHKVTAGHLVSFRGLETVGGKTYVLISNGWSSTPGLTKIDLNAF
jgi:hypothetical protein